MHPWLSVTHDTLQTKVSTHYTSKDYDSGRPAPDVSLDPTFIEHRISGDETMVHSHDTS